MKEKNHNHFLGIFDKEGNMVNAVYIRASYNIANAIFNELADNDITFAAYRSNPYDYLYQTDIKDKLYKIADFVIDNINDKIGEDIMKSDLEIHFITSLDYRNFDKQYDNELKFVEYIVSEQAKNDKQTIITEDMLINAGFEYLERESKDLNKFVYPEYESKYKVYRFWTKDNSILKLDIDNRVNNRGTEWHLHIDNCDCCTIGTADISNVWEFNTLMKIFKSEFRL